MTTIGFFAKAVRFYQQMKFTPRMPLWYEARFQLASLLLGEDHLARIPPLLDTKRDAGDPGAALRDCAAGCVLAALIGRDPGAWFATARTLADAEPDAVHHADLLLAMALTAGTTEDIASAVTIRHRGRPDSGECLLSTAMLAMASITAAADDPSDQAAVAFVGLEHGSQVPALALALAHRNHDVARKLLWEGASRLDMDLSPGSGILRARSVQDPTWKQVTAAGALPRLEARARFLGSGGAVHVFPYSTLMGIAAPWKILSDRCRENRDGILGDAGGEVRLIVECDGDVSLDPGAVEPVRARIPAGETWLRALYPAFRCSISLHVEPAAQSSS